MNYLVPAGTINNRTAYLYADSTKHYGPIVKKISDQILVIIDYTTVLSTQTITGYKFTSDVESNPPLYVTDPLISAAGKVLSFLVSGGIDGQQYNIIVGLNPFNGTPPTVLRDDVLTINMPSKSACDAVIPPMVTLLGSNSLVSTSIHFYWGPTPPAGPFVLDQWFDTATNILYEWITDGSSFFWEEIGVGGPDAPGPGGGGLVDAPADGTLYSRRNANWIADPIQVDATSDGRIYVRNNDNWIPDPLQIDAPADGEVWGRKDNEWAVVMGGTGGGIDDAPSDGNTYARRNSVWVIPKVGIVFVYSGMPPANQVINVPITFGINVPSSLSDVQTYISTLSTSNAIFILNKISGGVMTAIGTITINSGSHTTTSLSGSGGTLVVGDVLQMVAPSTQDTTLADVSITILVTRV